MQKALKRDNESGIIARNVQTDIEFYVNNFKKKWVNGSPSVKWILTEGLKPWKDDGIEIYISATNPNINK